LFREVLDEPVQDKCFDMAAACLIGSFAWSSSEERLNFFSQAEQQTSNTNLQALYHNQAATAREQILLSQGAQSQPETLVQNKLRADLRSGQRVLAGKTGTLAGDFGMDDFIDFFGDKSKGARKLGEVLPQLLSEFPQMAPHLTAAALGLQRDTNNPVLEQFKRQLDECRAHPEKVLALHDFWSRARYAAYPWCLQHGEALVATSILEGMKQAAAYTNAVSFADGDKLALAFGYKAAERWKEALDIFGSYSNLPVEMSSSGPWGEAFQPVLTSKEARFCREKLGLPKSIDPREFEMGTNCLCMHSPSSFATDPDGLWLAIGSQLIHLDYGLATNFMVTLPISPGTSINCLCIGSSNLWIGTDGEGLVEVDKRSRSITRYSDKEGLMSDVINSLCKGSESLWIGYGMKNGPVGYDVSRMQGGGLGQFDLARHQFHSFTPSLAQGG
jgi:hypothetical protein